MATSPRLRFKRNKQAIEYALKRFPCVALLGARQVGKTTLAKSLKKAQYFDLESEGTFNLISKDIAFFLSQLDKTVIFDEAQLLPSLFKELRVHIDKNRKKNGQFIITGSSSPELLHNISESLAGRIAIFEIEPLAINEIENVRVSSFYDNLIEFSAPKIRKSDFSKKAPLQFLLMGGYPEIALKRSSRFRKIWFENYIQTYFNRDIRRLFPSLQLETYRRFTRMLAYSSGDLINQSHYAGSLGVSSQTIKNYLQIAEGSFVFRELLGFSKHSESRLIRNSKGYIRDSGLLCFMLGIESVAQLFEHPKLGQIFEIYVIEQLRKSLKAREASFDLSYFRTSNQNEVDLILEMNNRLIPIEIKFGSTFRSENLKGLDFFMKQYKLNLGFLINNSSEIAEVAPNIFQIPFDYI